MRIAICCCDCNSLIGYCYSSEPLPFIYCGMCSDDKDEAERQENEETDND